MKKYKVGDTVYAKSWTKMKLTIAEVEEGDFDRLFKGSTVRYKCMYDNGEMVVGTFYPKDLCELN